MVPPNALRRAARSVLLRLSRPVKSVRDKVNSGRMAEPYVYDDSPIVDRDGAHPLLGHFAPDAYVSVGRRRERIRRFFGDGFVVLRFGEGSEVMVGSAVVDDTDGSLRDAYRVERPVSLLVRPDGHIAAVVEGELDDALARCGQAKVAVAA